MSRETNEGRGGELVPFGKHKGQPVEVLLADPGYKEWVLAQPWFRDRYPAVYQTIINYSGEPQETPEHNQMQASFLDDERCVSLAKALCDPSLFDGSAAQRAFETADRTDRSYGQRRAVELRDQYEMYVSPTPQRPYVGEREFEAGGWDIVFTVQPTALWLRLTGLPACACACDHKGDCPDNAVCRGGDNEYACRHRDHVDRGAPTFKSWTRATAEERWQFKRDYRPYYHCNKSCPWRDGAGGEWLLSDWARLYGPPSVRLRVECKPDLGDDFPAVLRQAARHEVATDDLRCVVVRRFATQSVSWEQVVQIFAASHVALIREDVLERERER